MAASVSLLRLRWAHGRIFRLASPFEHSGSQGSCPWARRICGVIDTRQGVIGHDAPIMPQVRHGHSGYGGGYDGFEGHWKEDVTSKVSDHPFTNLIQRSDREEKPMLVGCLFGGGDAH